eukprot:2197544-Pyramimonas_sp.AAC.1
MNTRVTITCRPSRLRLTKSRTLFQAELDAKKQRLVLEKQQGEQDKMISYIQASCHSVDLQLA